jgi:drug/metabolite transporter (DMT)-like permease
MLTLPLFGTLLGVLVLGEPIDRRFLVAASLVVGGAALLLSGRAAD